MKKKYSNFLFAFFMAVIMSFFMTFIISYLNIGFREDFIFMWLKAWLAGMFIAFPASLIATPIARKLTEKCVDK